MKKLFLASIAVIAHIVGAANRTNTPAEVWANPPNEAYVSCYWHWMGSGISTNGILKDLQYFHRVGIRQAIIFGLSDSVMPWAATIQNPKDGLIEAFTERWWRYVRYAVEQAKELGIDIAVHNCPGYTSSGGKWIPDEYAQRELVFSTVEYVSDGSAVSIKIPPASPKLPLPTKYPPFPVLKDGIGPEYWPLFPGRTNDIHDIALLAVPNNKKASQADILDLTTSFNPSTGILSTTLPVGSWTFVRAQHTVHGAFPQPTQWEALGMEVDKLNAEAVRFHISSNVIAGMKTVLGDLVGNGLNMVFIDSYEAGNPTWTPKMREEFTARRGYDPVKGLAALSPAASSLDTAFVHQFKKDFNRTVMDLFRDNYYDVIAEETHKAGLKFGCEPYETIRESAKYGVIGPFDANECGSKADLVATEFWLNDQDQRHDPASIAWAEEIKAPDGTERHIVAAEAFTAQPKDSKWRTTPERLKQIGDWQFCRGINRFILHSVTLQPWDDSVKPGMAMGRWGTHFGRNQTWAESGKAWFDYVARSQALLQWGYTAGKPSLSNINCGGILRRQGDSYVAYVANLGNKPQETSVTCPARGRRAEWFDPVTGSRTPIRHTETDSGSTVTARLAPYQSLFIVYHEPANASDKIIERAFAGTGILEDLMTLDGAWQVKFDPKWGGPKESVIFDSLHDWTTDSSDGVRYYSGTARYSKIFDIPSNFIDDRHLVLRLGNTNKQIAEVRLNGVPLGTVWCAPHEVRIPHGLLKPAGNELVIDFTNVWSNRLIGDNRFKRDCEWSHRDWDNGAFLKSYPDWFNNAAIRPSPERFCFTTWDYFYTGGDLTPSGLLGPVVLSRERL